MITHRLLVPKLDAKNRLWFCRGRFCFTDDALRNEAHLIVLIWDEEFRVSLFAQHKKTPYPVSAKRLDKAWDERN